MDKQIKQLKEHGERIGRLILQLQRMEKQPRSFGEAGELTPSEIHVVDAIGLDGQILMNELANRLQVTKGAVTQLVKRVEKKELIKRQIHPTDSRATILSLTEKGVIACTLHGQMQMEFYEKLAQEMNPESIQNFEQGLNIFIQLLSKD